MCGDNIHRPVLGGTIAILKPLEQQNLPDISLLFHHEEASFTTATFQSQTPATLTTPSDYERCQIVIYRDGDLRSVETPQNILHSFPLMAKQRTQGGREAFCLPKKLDLGVGGEGVIGRRVGLIRETPLGRRVLRQGIIGWN